VIERSEYFCAQFPGNNTPDNKALSLSSNLMPKLGTKYLMPVHQILDKMTPVTEVGDALIKLYWILESSNVFV
jgi:hypothetical protein